MSNFKNPAWRRRLIVMILGIIILGLGICLFKFSLMGNDPHSAMAMALGKRVGLSLSVILIIINFVWFVLEITLGRHFIGIGTFFNWVFVGIFADLWTSIIQKLFVLPEHFTGRLIIMILGVLILSFSAAMYQTADLGIAPYDAISLIMTEHLPIPYFWCRMITDSACAAAAFLLGGIIGLGTLVCAFGLGPFINFFTNAVAKKLCGYEQ